MTDKEAAKEFKEGVVAFFIALIIILGLFFLIVGASGSSEPEYKIVDQYKQCDVVRYTDPSQRYRYFLHCPTPP